MLLWHRLRAGIRSLWRSAERDKELDEELRAYFDAALAANLAAGMSQQEAARAAHITSGSPASVKEYVQDVGWKPRIDSVVQDLRYAARVLRRAPGFTIVSIVTLALGIGANTAVFSILDRVLLRPLPYASPDRLVAIGERTLEGEPSNIGYTTLADWRARSGSFESLSLMRSWLPTLLANREAQRLAAVRVSAGYFEMLGVQPALGRGFDASDDTPDQWRVVLLSDALWRRHFSADPAVVGRTVMLNDTPFRVVGVMPPSFEPLLEQRFYDVTPDVWAPLGYDVSMPSACRGCRHLRAFGKLRAGVSPESASTELTAVHARLRTELPGEYSLDVVAVAPLRDSIAGAVKPALWILFGAVALILLIACGNVANLLMARALGRQRELAVRSALGAGRSRLVRQLLTENLLLTATGALAGVALAHVCVGMLIKVAPIGIPRLAAAGVDARVLVFTAVTALVTGVFFGLLPALRGSAVPLQTVLASDARTSTGNGGRARAALVVLDLALAIVLLASAGVMLRTVATLMRVDPGFDAERVLTLQFSLVGQAWAEDAAVRVFQDRVLERVRALPGVERAALAGQVPFGGNGDTMGFHVRGRMKPDPLHDPEAERYSVTAEYFRVMEIPLKAGRLLTDQDTAAGEPVMVISEETARAVWGRDNPIGSVVRTGDHKDGPWRTVVGVVGDVNHDDLGGQRRPAMYLPQAQVTDSYLVLVVKAAPAPPQSLAESLRASIRQLDATVPVYGVASLSELLSKAVDQRRFVMRLLVIFAAIAVLLAAVGLYGVVSHGVEQRRRELGVRVALGATRADIGRLVLGGGAGVVLIGLGCGLLGAAAAVRVLGARVPGVDPADPVAFLGATAVLVTVAFAAHLIPLRRAVRLDPAIALRGQ